jgi:hypothetical protein
MIDKVYTFCYHLKNLTSKQKMCLLLMEQNKLAAYNNRQQLFLKNTFLVLIDLTILGFFNQYWDLIFIETFTIALLTAMLLQFLMQVALKIEHRVADRLFGDKTDTRTKLMRAMSAWAIIFVSKLVILKAISFSFGDSVVFSGPIHGLVAFLTLVIVIIIAEQLVLWVYRSLGDTDPKDLDGKAKFYPEEI